MKKKLSLIVAAVMSMQMVMLPAHAWNYRDWKERAETFGGGKVSVYEDTDVIIGPGEDVYTSDDVDVQKKTAAYNKLLTIGIIKGSSNDTPTDGGGITRAAFVQMVIRALNLEGVGAFEQFFVDVPKDHFAFNEICVAVNLGIISGYNGYFDAEKKITYLDATVILVNALGMRDEAIYRGGYNSGYLFVANRYHILSSTEITDVWAIADANTLYQMILNTVENDNLAVLEAIGPDSAKYKKGRNMLEVYHKIYTAEGVVDAVGQSNILSNKEYANDQVKMGELLLKGNYAECIDYLGVNTEILYKENDANENEIIYIEASPNNRIVTFSADDIASYDNGTYTYYQGEKKRTAKVTGDASLVYNGKINTVGIENPYIPEIGFVTLVSNTGSGAYNVIKVDSMTDIVVGAVIKDKGVVYDYIDRNISVALDVEDTDKIISLINTDGAEIYPAMATQKNVLSIYQSADGRVINAVLSNRTVAGTIEMISTDNGYTVATIGGENYRISKRCNEKFSKLLSAGRQVTLFLNAFNHAAYIEDGITGSSSDMQYAYVIAAELDNEVFRNEVIIKLLNADGTITVEKLPEKCTIDGNRYKYGDKQQTALEKGLSIGNVIMCARDADGLIYKIDTAYVETTKEETKTSLRPFYNKAMFEADKEKGNLLDDEIKNNGLFHKKNSTGGIFSEAVFWTPERTVFFIVNENETNDEEKYRVEALVYPFSNDKYYQPEIYANNDDYYADAIVHTIESGDGVQRVASSDMWVVTDVTFVLHNEEKMTGFHVTNGSTEKTVVIDPSRLTKLSIDIAPGDVVIFDESYGKIVGNNILKLYDYDTQTQIVGSGWFNDVFRKEAAYIYDVNEGLFTMYITNNVDDMSNIDDTDLVGNKKFVRNRKVEKNYVKVEKLPNGKIIATLASINDLKPYVNVGNEASRVFVNYQYMIPQSVFIFE